MPEARAARRMQLPPPSFWPPETEKVLGSRESRPASEVDCALECSKVSIVLRICDPGNIMKCLDKTAAIRRGGTLKKVAGQEILDRIRRSRSAIAAIVEDSQMPSSR